MKLYCGAVAVCLAAAASLPTLSLQASTNTNALKITREGSQLKITFTGTLESATASVGPWTNLANASSPLLQDAAGDQRFYRTRTQEVAGIFNSQTVVQWKVTGPLQKHFQLAFAGTPDGIFPPVREKPYFDGTLQMDALALPISLRVRGNSSLQECPFPKLKFKVSKEDRAGTPFADARELKIGTHCAEGGRGNVGRLRDERAAHREALAYETMDQLGFTSPRVRRAVVQYQDTTSTNDATEVGWTLSRHAVILEDIEVLADRLGARPLDETEISTLPAAAFEPQLIVDLEMLHALLGNWDYRLAPGAAGVWNTDVIELADGRLVPVAGDFDLASWVTGEVRLSAPVDYRPDLGEVERQARFELEQVQGRTSADRFTTARQRFLARRSQIEMLTQTVEVDEEGRTNAFRHVSAFYSALEELVRP